MSIKYKRRSYHMLRSLPDNLNITFDHNRKPGEQLIKLLDKSGLSLDEYNTYLNASYNVKTIKSYYKPWSKVAIIVANDKYLYLSKLATPSMDCDSLATKLKIIGFTVITIKNSTSHNLRTILSKIFDVLEEDSYCFFFYAGHGCQLCNTKCMLGIDCPAENIQLDHCVTENFVLQEAEKCKLDLCVLIMDMCRIYLDRQSNPEVFSMLPTIEEYSIHKNLLISYSTQSSCAAYEVLQIECSTTIDDDVTYQLKTGDTDKIVPGASLYVNALCTRVSDNLDVSTMLDKVHEDVENSFKKQKAIKVQCGVGKRSLYDPPRGDEKVLLASLTEATKDFSGCVGVF